MTAAVGPDELADGVRVPDEQTVTLLTAVVLLRVALLVWSAVVVAIDIQGAASLRSGVAVVVLAALALWTGLHGSWVRRRPELVTRWWVTVVDVGLAAVVAALDWYVYTGPHPQTFASAWPLCAAVVAGVVRGARAGALAGLLVGVADCVGVELFRDGGLDGRWMAALGTIVLLSVSGAMAGAVTSMLRRAEVVAARAQAREEVARRLHDGVLQTLAVVQRRSDDASLVALAREQELDLRRFIETDDPRGSGDLVAELRSVLRAAERRTSLRCELVVIDPPGPTTPEVVEGLCGAVNEAVTNAAKHGDATRVTVCLDADGPGLTCSVNDDGVGFDPAHTAEGTGLTRSVRGRIEELGGSVRITTQPGAGCELAFVLDRVDRPPR